MGNLLMFLIWTCFVAWVSHLNGVRETDKGIVAECVSLGSIERQNIVIRCDPAFIRSNGKLIPWKEIPDE